MSYEAHLENRVDELEGKYDRLLQTLSTERDRFGKIETELKVRLQREEKLSTTAIINLRKRIRGLESENNRLREALERIRKEAIEFEYLLVEAIAEKALAGGSGE